jgi:arylformamidase
MSILSLPLTLKMQIFSRTRRILFKTRNSNYWTAGEKAFQTNFVALSLDAAEYLVDRCVKLVGIDYLSIAPYKHSRPTHEALLKAGIVILEGLDLSAVSQGRYSLYCLPLNSRIDGAWRVDVSGCVNFVSAGNSHRQAISSVLGSCVQPEA